MQIVNTTDWNTPANYLIDAETGNIKNPLGVDAVAGLKWREVLPTIVKALSLYGIDPENVSRRREDSEDDGPEGGRRLDVAEADRWYRLSKSEYGSYRAAMSSMWFLLHGEGPHDSLDVHLALKRLNQHIAYTLYRYTVPYGMLTEKELLQLLQNDYTASDALQTAYAGQVRAIEEAAGFGRC